MINQKHIQLIRLHWVAQGAGLGWDQGLPYTPKQVGVGTQVVTVVAVGAVKMTVVQISVPTQASYLPHPAAAADEKSGLLASSFGCVAAFPGS